MHRLQHGPRSIFLSIGTYVNSLEYAIMSTVVGIEQQTVPIDDLRGCFQLGRDTEVYCEATRSSRDPFPFFPSCWRIPQEF